MKPEKWALIAEIACGVDRIKAFLFDHQIIVGYLGALSVAGTLYISRTGG